MIAVDTNLVVRWLVADDAAQATAVERLFERCADAGRRVLVTIPVLCELDWVLRRVYRVPRHGVVDVYRSFLADDLWTVADRSAAEAAIERFAHGNADLADYLIGVCARQLGADTTYTFDRALRDEEGFTLL